MTRSAGQQLRIFVPHASDVLTDHLPVGDGLVAFGFIQHLAQRGHLLDVVSPRIEISGPVPSGVRLFRLPPRTNIARLAMVDYMMRVRSLYNRLDRATPYDVIHQLNPVNTGISLAFAGARKPIVLGNLIPNWTMDEEGRIIGDMPGRLLRIGKNTVLGIQQRLAAAILLTTPAARSRLCETKSVEPKLFMLPHGIDDRAFFESEFHDPPVKNVLFLANLLRRKGIYTLLEAFDIVVAAFPQATLTIAGDGLELDAVRRYVEAKPWAANARVLGPVSRAELPQLLRTATVYCLPSYDEPYGMSVLEAMAAGRPVVATSGGGLGYLLTDGAVAVAPHDASALAKALVDVLGAPSQVRAAMGAANRREISATYAWSAVIPRLEAIYHHVLAGKPAA